jgi:hypothetical protein
VFLPDPNGPISAVNNCRVNSALTQSTLDRPPDATA